MTKGFFYDDEDEDDEQRIGPRPLRADEDKDAPAAGTIPPYSFAPTDTFDTRAYVATLFKKPLFGAPLNAAPQRSSETATSSHQNGLRPAPTTTVQSNRPAFTSAPTILSDDTGFGRWRETSGALDTADDVTTTQAREPYPGVIPPAEAAHILGNDLGFVGKAIDTMATAIGSAVRAYRSGVIMPHLQMPRSAQTANENHLLDASLPHPERSLVRPSRQYAELPGVDSDTRSARGDDKRHDSHLEVTFSASTSRFGSQRPNGPA